MFVTFLPPLSPAALLGGAEPLMLEAGAMLFGRSREALGASLSALGLKRGDVVLAPASICWEALEPMLARGLTIRCYPLDAALRLDLATLQALADERTRAVLVVHYYGFAQDIAPVRAWCDTRGLRLIEDCALCFYDGKTNGGVGRQGDIAVFSLWKYLPVPDGAVLLSRLPVPPPQASARKPWIRLARLLAAFLAARGLFPLGYSRRRKPLSYQAKPAAPELTEARLMSRVSVHIWDTCDTAAIAAARRANYRALAALLAGVPGLELLRPDLDAQTVPFALLLRCADPVALHLALLARDFETELSINRFFAGVEGIEGDGFPVVEDLAGHVLALPVHQGLTPQQIDRLACAVRECLA